MPLYGIFAFGKVKIKQLIRLCQLVFTYLLQFDYLYNEQECLEFIDDNIDVDVIITMLMNSWVHIDPSE